MRSPLPATRYFFLCALACAVVTVLLIGAVGCRNTIVGEPDAGPDDGGPDVGGEGEGDGGEGEGDCPAVARSALSLRVADSVTSVVLCDATVTLAEDAFNDAAVVVGAGADCRYQAAFGRPGTYVLTVQKAGYTAFTNPVFDVSADACGEPITREFDVELEPL